MDRYGSSEVHEFWEGFAKSMKAAVAEARGEIEIVGAIQGNALQAYKRGDSYDQNSQLMLQVLPAFIEVGDRVFTIRGEDGGKYVLGKILEIGDTPIQQPEEPWIPVWGSDTDTVGSSTSSTTTYTTKCSFNMTLGPGVWTIEAFAFGSLIHSASNAIDLRLVVASQATVVTRTATSTATVRSGFMMTAKNTLVDGDDTYSVNFQFKSNVAGTSTIYDGVLFAIAYRTD